MIGRPRYLWRLVAASAAVAGLLLHVLALAVHGPGALKPVGAAVAGELQTVLICTVHGAQSITLDAEGNQVEQPLGPSDARNWCPLCHVLGTVTFGGPALGPLLDAPQASDAARPIVEAACPAGRNAGIQRNRGPPARSAV